MKLESTSLLGSSDYFTRIYHDVMSANLKLFKENVQGKDHVSTVVLRVFLSQTFPFISVMLKNSLVHVICKLYSKKMAVR